MEAAKHFLGSGAEPWKLWAAAAGGCAAALLRYRGLRGTGSAARAGDDRSAYSLAAAMLAVALGTLGLSYAAVPLYRIFCQTTGFGGTPKKHGGGGADDGVHEAQSHPRARSQPLAWCLATIDQQKRPAEARWVVQARRQRAAQFLLLEGAVDVVAVVNKASHVVAECGGGRRGARACQKAFGRQRGVCGRGRRRGARSRDRNWCR